MFTFKNLPLELRLKIYRADDVLQIQFDGSAPTFLQALRCDLKLWVEALDVYKTINATYDMKGRLMLPFATEVKPLARVPNLRIIWNDGWRT